MTRLSIPLQSKPAPRPAPKPGKTPFILAAAILVVLLAFAGTWWWLSHHASNSHPPAQATTAPAAQPAASALPKPSALSPAILNNQAVLDMVQAHVADPVIIDHIHSSPTNFSLTTAEIIRLTKGGVSSAVLQAMHDPSGKSQPAAADASHPPTNARELQLTGGQPLEIGLTADVPPDVQPGQPLSFKVTKSITVDDTVVIPEGAAVTGQIVEGARKRFLIHTTRPTYKLLEVTAVNGTKVKIRATPGRLGESRKDPALDPVGGSKSKDAVALAGSRFVAYIDGDQTVTIHK